MARILLLVSLIICLFAPAARAQDAPVAAPDVRGQSVPAAAAALNAVGLRLGAVTPARWTQESGWPQDRVGAQTPAPGDPLASGAAVDVTVLRLPNVLLIYDENDLTLVNNTGAPLPLAGIAVAADDGRARFEAARWPGGVLAPRDCSQIWAVPRGEPKPWDECPGSTFWLTTGNIAEHAWTATSGVTTFSLVQDGQIRATCPAAPAGSEPLRCEGYLPAAAQAEETAFVYFSYTADQLVIVNPTADQWMPLAQTVVFNFNPNIIAAGAPVPVGDAALFGSPAIVAEIGRLAPGQCLRFTNSSMNGVPPAASCVAIAQLNIDPALVFWAAPFEMVSLSDGQRRTCPAATPGKPTICILPR